MEPLENQLSTRGALSYYLAGLFDGEGSFFVNLLKNKNWSAVLRIKISSTDEQSLIEIKNLLGFGKVYSYNAKNLKENHLQGYAYYLSNFGDIEKFVDLIDGKLIIKRKALQVFKEAMKIVEEKRKRGITKASFTKEEIEKLVELREKLTRRHSKFFRNKEWFAKEISREGFSGLNEKRYDKKHN